MRALFATWHPSDAVEYSTCRGDFCLGLNPVSSQSCDMRRSTSCRVSHLRRRTFSARVLLVGHMRLWLCRISECFLKEGCRATFQRVAPSTQQNASRRRCNQRTVFVLNQAKLSIVLKGIESSRFPCRGKRAVAFKLSVSIPRSWHAHVRDKDQTCPRRLSCQICSRRCLCSQSGQRWSDAEGACCLSGPFFSIESGSIPS